MSRNLENYQLRGNPVMQVQVPVIGNLIFDDLGEEVISKFNERFKGVSQVEYTNKHKKEEPISYSNTPRALGINSILREITNGKIRVLSPEEVVRYWDLIPDKTGTYSDTDSIVIYPNSGLNEELRQEVLKLTGKESKLPLIVSGLDVERADNIYGFRFKGTDYMRVSEAPFLRRDGKLIYEPSKDELESSDEGVFVWVSNAQSGLCGLYRVRVDGLDAWVDYLLVSSEAGRVQVISGAAAPKNRKVNRKSR